MHTILVFVILAIGSVSGQNLTRILRDEISGNNMRTDVLISSSEATENADADSVPYVGGPNQWRVPLSNGTGFTTPTFLINDNTPATPTYAIFAIEIQNNLTDGACGTPSTQLARIRLSEVSIGLVNTANLVNVSSYREGGEQLNLERMGLTNENNLIRFNIPRMDGDLVQFEIEATNPNFDDPNPHDVCLQVEFLGARISMGSPDPPSINESPLLQYNMNRPDFSYLGNSYDDLAYSGVRGSLYTGGVGVLTDGIIGTDPRSSLAEWVGFSTQGRVRLFLNREYPILDIIVYFWMDEPNGAVAPMGGARDRNGQLNQFTFSTEQFENIPNLYLYTGLTSGNPVMLDFLEIPLGTTQGLLVTEISLIDGMFNELINTSAITIISGPANTPAPVTSTQGGGSTPRPPPTPQAIPVDTIVFAVVGVVGCCCVSLIIMVVSILFVVAFVYFRKSSKRKHSKSEACNGGVNSRSHESLARRLSDKYLSMQGRQSYSQFKTPDSGDYANPDADNLYQEVDRPLPLPPVPGEDSYIEMSQTNRPGLTIDTSERKLRAMRTLSEDDYMPVTPPSVSADKKQPPERIVSEPYVTVTPPHTPVKPATQTKEDTFEATTPSDSATRHLEFQGTQSVPNEYVDRK